MSRFAPILGLLLAVLLSVGFYFLLWQPLAEEQEELEQETADLISQQQSLRNEIDSLLAIKEREVEIRAELAKLEEYIPTGVAQPAIIRELQLSADASGVEVMTVSFSAPRLVEDAPPTGDPEMALAEVTVSATVEGGYFQIVDLFRRFEVDVPRAILLGNFNMAEGTEEFPHLTSTWTASLFTVVPVTEAEPAESEDPEAPADEDADADADDPDDGVDEGTDAEVDV